MGGKNKQSQRTKNNARPSSSGRSAELLNNTLRAEGGTLLAGGKALPALFPTLAATALDSTIPPEFALCFKKLNKKDPITRVKALQELTELVGNSKAEDVAEALPAWPRAYRALAADPDGKVREHAQTCHGAFVSACGRRVAPHLRALLPVWLQSQHDEHACAQCVARRTLQSTFPSSRLPEVVSFCRAEVAAHVLQALPTPPPPHAKVEDAEERELLQISAQRGALQTLRALATTLPAEHSAWLATTLQPLLNNAAFWQLRTHADPQLRAAWFAALGQVWALAGPHIEGALSQKALRAVLGAPQSGPPAAPHYWAALLQIMHTSPEWYEWLDKKELLVKRILDLLENGGWGEARSLADTLLPLLARLPPALRTQSFYGDFFRASLHGLMTKNVISSKSERQWWITSLAECLRYVSIQSEDFISEVVTSVHRHWLEAVTTHPDPQTRTNIIRHSATNMTSLVKYWLKLSKKENGDKFDQLVRNFWQNVGSTIITQIEKASTESEEVTRLIEGHILLLHTLKVSFLQELKKQQSIKFEGDTNVEENVVTEQTEDKSDTVDTDRYIHNLNDVVFKVCCSYFEFAWKKQMANVVFGPLVTLLLEFESEELLTSISRQFGADSAYSLYDKVLRDWLCGDTMRCKAVVDIVFLVIEHLTEAEQDAVFDSFKQFPPSVAEWCVRAALSHPHRSLPATRRWLRGSLVEHAVLALCRRALCAGDAGARGLLLMCLSQDDAGELTVSEACLWRAVELVSGQPWEPGAAVTSPTDEGVTSQPGETTTSQTGEKVTSQTGEKVTSQTGETVSSPAARVALAAALWAALPAHAPTDIQLRLAGSMFRLTLCIHRGDPQLPADSWDEARGCWQDLSPPVATLFLAEAVSLMHRHLVQQSETLNIAEIEHIASLCPYLLTQCEADQPTDVTEVVQLTKQLFDLPPEDANTPSAEVFALKHDCVTSNLNCLFDDDIDNDHIKKVIDDSANVNATDLTKDSILSHLNKFLFRAIYLRTILLRKPEEEDEDSTEKAKCWCETLFKDKYIVEEFTRVLYDYCVLCSLHEGYAYWPHYSLIQQAKQKLDVLLDDVIAETSAEARGSILSSLSEKAATVGYYWAFARKWFATKIGEKEGGATDGEVDKNLQDIVTGNGFFHSMQANSKHSTDPGVELRTAFLTMLRSLYAAYSSQGDVIDERFLRDASAAQRDCGIDVLVHLYYRHKLVLLHRGPDGDPDRNVNDVSWPRVVTAAAAARYLEAAVVCRGWELSRIQGDFVTIAMCSLLDALARSEAWGSTKVAMLAHSVFKLYRTFKRFISSIPEECEKRELPPHLVALPREFDDVFAMHATRWLILCTLRVLESALTPITITTAHICYMSSLSAAIAELRWPHVPPPETPSLERVTRACCDVMRVSTHHALIYFAHDVLLAMAEALVLEDAEKLIAWEALAAAADDEEAAARSRPQMALEYFLPAVAAAEAAVDDLLQPYRIGEEPCSLQPHTRHYNTVLGYLLLSDALHCALCIEQRQDRALQYIALLRENRMSELLLTSSLRLLPPALAALIADTSSATSVPQQYLDMFVSVKKFNVYEAPQSGDIGALACRGAFGACAGAGRAAARAWSGAAPPRASRLAHRLVKLCIAPPLVKAQLQDLSARKHQLQDAQISIAWSSREATCCYRVEETPLQVTVAFGEAHPLQPPRVTAPHRAAPPHAAHWLQLYLAYQNGSLVKAIQMWMRAVSARLERSPQCYICYCRLQPASGRLPSVPCRQCNNKFHTQCLRKWFATSNKTTCPLCRGAF